MKKKKFPLTKIRGGKVKKTKNSLDSATIFKNFVDEWKKRKALKIIAPDGAIKNVKEIDDENIGDLDD